jgi:serine/threonine protein kinase
MSEAVVDEAIEQIADGLAVDWSAIDRGAPGRAREWANSLRVLNDIVKLHRDAAADYEQTTMSTAAPTNAAPSPSPDTWGKYTLTNKVGEGSYGSVYRAWDSDLEYDVAIKILHRRVGDMKLRERLLQEGRALAKIQHNNVVRVLGIEAHADRVGLCMEFVRGKTLADIVRGQGRLSAAEAVLIGEDLCRALSAVHRAGFIHRDVKAKNVMRDDNGRIVLMDFGTGRSSEALNKSDRAGTPLYMAPEVIEDGEQSVRSDVYSLGVLLYYLVTAEYPVNARSIDELRMAHANREHRWLSEVRPELPVTFMQVVERAIALNPEDRYANASELLSALGSIGLGERSALWTFARPLIAFFVIVAGMGLLGAITTTQFNIALQRSGFSTTSESNWLVWGMRTSIPPFLIALVMMLGATVLAMTRRLVITVSDTARRADGHVRLWLMGLVHRCRLDDVSVAGTVALLVSSLATYAAMSYFKPLIMAVISYVSTAPASSLALLAPTAVGDHNQYRWVFSLVVILSAIVWYPVLRLVRKGQSLYWGLAVGGAVSMCVAMALLHLPYRMLYFNKSFEKVTWSSNTCYLIGERADDALLFCPEIGVPRLRTVKQADPTLVRLGITESIFKSFAPAANAASLATQGDRAK